MMKRVLFYMMIAVVAYSCNQAPGETATSQEVQIADLILEPLTYEDKLVSVSGTITHICRRSGDKMRVVQSCDPSVGIMVMLNDMQSQFTNECEGLNVKLTGIMKMRRACTEEHAHEAGHTCAEEQASSAHAQVFSYIELTGYEIMAANIDKNTADIVVN